MDDVDAIWEEFRRHDARIRSIEMASAASEAREEAHQREIESMMREFRNHAGQEEVSLTNFRRENAERHEMLQKAIGEINRSLAAKDGAISFAKTFIPGLVQAVVVLSVLFGALYKAGILG